MTVGVSILIPTHNRGPILDRTLQSLSEMRIPADARLELVVVANACTDNTTERVQSWQRRLKFPVRCECEERVGLGHARNRGVRSSCLEICALLDDDVWVDAGWLESLLRVYPRTGADLIAGRAELWWEAVDRPAWLTPRLEMSLSGLDLGPAEFEMFTPDAVGANFSFLRTVYDQVGPFRTDLDRVGQQLLGGGDTYFVREAQKRGRRLFYSPDVSVKHWVSPHRIGASYLTGVTFGSSYANVIMKERYGPLDAARSMLLGMARMGAFVPVGAWAALTNNIGLGIHAATRRAAGRGQFRGAIARLRNGPLTPQYISSAS